MFTRSNPHCCWPQRGQRLGTSKRDIMLPKLANMPYLSS